MIMKIPTSPIDYGCHDQSNDFDSDYEQIYDDLLLEIDSDFSEYLWMENEEEFDKMVKLIFSTQKIFKFY